MDSMEGDVDTSGAKNGDNESCNIPVELDEDDGKCNFLLKLLLFYYYINY
jgi:hypothetical protein